MRRAERRGRVTGMLGDTGGTGAPGAGAAMFTTVGGAWMGPQDSPAREATSIFYRSTTATAAGFCYYLQFQIVDRPG